MASLIGRIERRCASPLFRAASAPACRAAYRTTATAAVAQQHTPVGPIAGKHYVVIGAGLAGLATAYHLLVQSTTQGPVHVTVFDAVGIGAGGSGAAAGLLHPFAPTGKLLWRAQEAMEAAVELLAAAEAAAAQDPGLPDCIAWRTGMLKPATSNKQSQSFWKLYGSQHQQPRVSAESLGAAAGAGTQQQQQLQALLTAAVLSSSAAQQLLPGVQLPSTTNEPADLSGGPTAQVQCAANTEQDQQQAQMVQRQRQRQAKRQQREQQLPPGWSPESSAALHVPAGITLQPLHYMRALWSASQHAAAARGDGSSITLQIQQLQSLADVIQHFDTSSSALQQQQQQEVGCDPLQRVQQGQLQHVDAVIVAAGAAVGSLAEIGEQLPITLCQGYTLDMVPPAAAGTTTHPADDAAAGAAETTAAAAAAGVDAGVGPPAAAGGVLFPAAGPSILGSPYLASQGGQLLVVGATKQYNCSTEQAVAELRQGMDPSILAALHQQQQVVPAAAADWIVSEGPQAEEGQPRRCPSSTAVATAAAAEGALSQGGAQLDKVAEVAAAAQELLSGAGATWPSIRHWSIAGIRSGVRALPPRSAQGVLPIAGRWTELQVTRHCQVQQAAAHQQAIDRVPVWLLVGLGARGLVYHAWLGKLVAAAVVSNSEEHLPAELLAWRQQPSPQQS